LREKPRGGKKFNEKEKGRLYISGQICEDGKGREKKAEAILVKEKKVGWRKMYQGKPCKRRRGIRSAL